MDVLHLSSELTDEDRRDRDDAAREYRNHRDNLGIFCSLDELQTAFNRPGGHEGLQIRQYFRFLQFVLINNVVMSIWALIGWLPHVRNIIPRLQQSGKWATQDGGSLFEEATDVLFLSSYQPSSDAAWTTMLVLGSLTMALSGPLHYIILARQTGCLDFIVNRKVAPSADKDEDSYNETVHKDDKSPYFDEYSNRPGARHMRRLLSYCVFAVVCGALVGINYSLLYVANHRSLQAGHAAV
jgi:hypothetical protein